jgi:hypothetical protein
MRLNIRIVEMGQEEEGFGKVHFETDYYDGPRAGVADFQGEPHYFECPEDESIGYSSYYYLRKIDEEAFRLALEDYEIWKRWKAAFDAGKATLESHPCLPSEKERHDELSAYLEERLKVDTKKDLKVIPRFEYRLRKLSDERAESIWVKWEPA